MKIPKQAKKVFDGVVFDVYQWPQELFDKSIATYEMLKRKNTVEIIPIMDDKICLIYEEQPTLPVAYSVVGGQQDFDETPLDCAKRELLEETGLASNDWELIKEFDPYNKIEWTISRFIARNCQKVAEQNLDPGEKIELRPVAFDEFMKIMVSDRFRSQDVTADILKMIHFGKFEEFKNKLFKK
ncbi:MAG: NUDIX hydrolase [Candidatus Magasanikbacteria bacterium GW2011_GWC2_37_14]|uniref:NUDIX hydrolase n=1 Tax=Candidatus Magasanikbacteria bacterium GW2011_GWC2_37_14 TaxID=1619046 RepID=A0A0G0GE11_9BACT|nr:MAG: NUDIX hydrolase [Candidatus Magasanikbacteria bacterium GW2011_GWC2_37_14]